MSEHSTPEERTELPTDRRMKQLREEGNVHQSKDLPQVIGLLVGFLTLRMIWSWLLQVIETVMKKAFNMISNSETLTVSDYYAGFVSLMGLVLPPLLLLMVLVAAVAVISVMLQTKWNVKKKWIDPKLENFNPIKGIKKIFSIQSIVQTLKSIAKLAIILPIGYFALVAYAPEMIMLIHLTVTDVMKYIGIAIFKLFWKIMYILIILAIFDYYWTRYQWFKQNKMTKDEIKDEKKAVEGDESTKRRMQAKGFQRIWQRIQQSVPQADVVVTNPTHYAIALKYDRETMLAPTVVAKGRGFLALRIREIAKKSNVPVLERKILARALYASVEVGAQIPHELFKAVAEVLAYVYKLKNPHGYARQMAS